MIWIVPKNYFVPRRMVKRALETLDGQDSPERPGMMYETTLTGMVDRFDSMFLSSEAPRRKSQRSEQVASVLEHLHRHTRRRRGESVLKEGYIEWEQTSRVYDLFSVDLNIFERIFFTVDVSESTSILSKCCSVFLVTMILLSIVVWMVSTLPQFHVTPADCHGTNIGDCEPKPLEEFKFIEMFCVYVFTTEYLIRLCTVHSVRFQLLNEHFMEVLLTAGYALGTKARASRLKRMATTGQAVITGRYDTLSLHLDGRFMTTVKHIFNIANIIDLMAILPFWIETIQGEGDNGGGALMVLRILRLTRIFRVFKLGKYNDVFLLFSRVIHQSMPALSLMLFFISLGCCLFGTLIWFAEGGQWYPPGHQELVKLGIEGRGAYLRPVSMASGAGLEETPFLSIVHSFWYVIVTITTVGYGDAFPTTTAGKIVGALTILNGIIVLAMPIGVVGANFSSEYYRVLDEKRKRQRLKHQMETLAQVEAEQDEALEIEDTDERSNAEAESQAAQIAVELHKVDMVRQRILADAEDIDARWQQSMPSLLYNELSKSLRHFLSSFLLSSSSMAGDATISGIVGTPVVSISKFHELDALTARVHASLTSMTSVEDLAEFGLKEAHDYRRQWAMFLDRCWEYAVDVCRVEKPKEPPEFFQMKAYLVRSATSIGHADPPALKRSGPRVSSNGTVVENDATVPIKSRCMVAEIGDIVGDSLAQRHSGKPSHLQAEQVAPPLPGMPEELFAPVERRVGHERDTHTKDPVVLADASDGENFSPKQGCPEKVLN